MFKHSPSILIIFGAFLTVALRRDIKKSRVYVMRLSHSSFFSLSWILFVARCAAGLASEIETEVITRPFLLSTLVVLTG